MLNELEQRRRKLRHTDPDLHMYIEYLAAAKVLDAIGDAISGISHEAANAAWSASSENRIKATKLNEA